jgi:hypothetical protein
VPRRDEGDAQLADQQGEGMTGMTRKQSLTWLILGAALQVGAPALAADANADANNKTIVFVYLHGSVKSQMAAAHDVAARDVIVSHIEDLIPTLPVRPRPQQTLRGVVTGIDERNDRITLRLSNEVASDFKVQDALVFNAARDGDQVQITVEKIEEAKTIVGLRKE